MTDTADHDAAARPPRLRAPPGTADVHIHIYGPPERYPEAPTSTFTPPPAPVSAYRRVMRRLGIDRVVVVQPSAYGFDNRCTLDAVAEFGDAARAVVVLPTDSGPDAFAALHAAGARGIRFHMLGRPVYSFDDLAPMAARAAEHGWHIQLQLDGRRLPDHEEALRRLPCPLVIDHTGKFLEPVAPEHEAFRSLLRLVGTGRVWVKLSAPYETSRRGPPDYPDVGALARVLVRAAPERMMWASNWPHPAPEPWNADEAVELDRLLAWCDDDAVRNRILADNPAAFYGFGP